MCKCASVIAETSFEKGEKRGIDLMARLMKILLDEKRFDDAARASEDAAYRDRLMKEYHLI